MKPPLTIGIDLGGTNLKTAVVDRDGRILAQRSESVDTAAGPERVVSHMAQHVDALLAELGAAREQLVAIGLGTPGPLSIREGRIIKAANLPDWRNVPIVEMVAEKIGAPTTLDNDGNLAALGEHWRGAGRGCDTFVMLTLGTGVGAGIILNRQVLHGHFDNAGELGHMIVVPDGIVCACGQRGCLEQYASASAIAHRVVGAIGEGEASMLREAVCRGELIDAERVVTAARAEDALCLRVWDEACYFLALASINLQHMLNPEKIVIGGGMSAAGSFLIKRVERYLQGRTWSLYHDVPQIVLAELGSDAGVVGAAALAWQQSEHTSE